MGGFESTLRPGLVFGRFRLRSPMGRGSFAEVWRAVHRSGTEVAIKVSHREGDRALEREAIRIARLDHPGVVYAYDFGWWGRRPWLAIELATGTLAGLASPLPLRDLTAHLLRALAHLHAHGTLHRDIKPSNILVGCAPRVGWDEADRSGVRLADFGIAWAGEGDVRSGSSGSPGWACPEQRQGNASGRAPHADLYSLAKVVEYLLEGAEEGAWGPWLARALHPDPEARFPTAAHALAALPSSLDARSSPRRPQASADTATQPVLTALPEITPPSRPPPCPVMAPPWPEGPPIAPIRVPRVALLDTGQSLLSHRPVPLAGRMPLLLALWREAGLKRELCIEGSPEDMAEVEQTLTRWAKEAGQTLTWTSDEPRATPVRPLSTSALRARLAGLGLEPVSAVRLASRCTGWTEVQGLLAEFVRDQRVVPTDEGLAIAELLPSRSMADASFLDRWWEPRGPRLAETIAEMERDTEVDPQFRGWCLLLGRARLENLGEPEVGHRLLEASDQARARSWFDLADALASVGLSVLNRARRAEDALDALNRIPTPRDLRVAAWNEMVRAFAYMQLHHADTEATLRRAAEACDGRYRVTARSTLADLGLQRGNVDMAKAEAEAAVSATHDGVRRPDEVVLAYLALVRVHVTLKSPEREIAALLEVARPFAQATPNSAVQWRYHLFCAQHAMRERRWDDADHLLAAAQTLASRQGTPETTIVLNHGLVALHRGDLGSISTITPPDWPDRIAKSPPYIRGIMELHQLFVDLGLADEPAIETSFAVLEARASPLPSEAAEPIRNAAALAPSPYRARLLALAPPDPG
ncbi:MAG: serine/threonine-protein kinase [Myxococcota bacterium]